MKHLLFILIASIVLTNCSSETDKKADGADTPVQEETEGNLTESIACKICLLEDSISTYEQKFIMLQSVSAEESEINTIRTIQNELKESIAPLKKEFNGTNDETQNACLEEYFLLPGDIDEEDMMYLRDIYSYRLCRAYTEGFNQFTPKNKPDENGKYRISVKGVFEYLSKEEYKKGIDNYIESFDAFQNYRETKTNEAIKKLSGKELDELPESYFLMAQTIARILIQKGTFESGVCADLLKDSIYTKLRDAVLESMTYAM